MPQSKIPTTFTDLFSLHYLTFFFFIFTYSQHEPCFHADTLSPFFLSSHLIWPDLTSLHHSSLSNRLKHSYSCTYSRTTHPWFSLFEWTMGCVRLPSWFTRPLKGFFSKWIFSTEMSDRIFKKISRWRESTWRRICTKKSKALYITSGAYVISNIFTFVCYLHFFFLPIHFCQWIS